MKQKSVTSDEIMYIAAGYYHIQTGDFQLNMTNPPLMKLLSAFPLIALDLKLPFLDGNPKNWGLIKQWQYARTFLYQNSVKADEILFLARLPIVVMSLILGLFVFSWSKELYGENAGLFALFLYSFSPNLLAHSRLATQDLGLTALMFISSYYFWKYATHRSTKSLILCGITFGLGILTKSTAFLLIPIFAIYGMISVLCNHDLAGFSNKAQLGQNSKIPKVPRRLMGVCVSILLIGLLGIITLNFGYGFQGSFEPISQNHDHPNLYKRLPINNALTRGVTDSILALPLPVPEPYLQGIKFQSTLVSQTGDIYFAGTLHASAPWYVLPATILIKTPLPILILLALSIGMLLVQRRKLEGEWLIATFISVITLVFIYLSNVNIALRYVLPIFPFFFVLIGRLCTVEIKHRKPLTVLMALLSTWFLYSSVSIYPHYLAYFNEVIGGPKNGYQYLVDSNLDWGQDLKGLKQYMNEKGLTRIKLGYFGSADASFYGIDYDYLPSVGLVPKEAGQYWWYEIDSNNKTQLAPQTGLMAVSATLLASPGWMKAKFGESYEWLRSHDPIDNIGYSILIYDIDRKIVL